MIKIVVNYNDYLWGDSTLEKIEIEMEYSNIIFTIFNDMAQKNIYINCTNCMGMFEFISWDENIIDNIFVEEIFDKQHPMIAKLKKLYGNNLYDTEKCIEGSFYKLRILFINEVYLDILCKDICFTVS